MSEENWRTAWCGKTHTSGGQKCSISAERKTLVVFHQRFCSQTDESKTNPGVLENSVCVKEYSIREKKEESIKHTRRSYAAIISPIEQLIYYSDPKVKTIKTELRYA